MKVEITGASDDLIEIEGDLREEFSPHDPEMPNYLAFSDGTLLSIQYGVGGGFWRIHRLAEGTASYRKIEATDDSGKDYSDRVMLDGDHLTWVVCGDQIKKRREEKPHGGRQGSAAEGTGEAGTGA